MQGLGLSHVQDSVPETGYNGKKRPDHTMATASNREKKPRATWWNECARSQIVGNSSGGINRKDGVSRRGSKRLLGTGGAKWNGVGVGWEKGIV